MRPDPVPGEQPEELYEHAGYLRRLARSLLFDPALAEDVVQRTWIEALRQSRSAETGSTPRAWLVGVVRNLSRQTRREEARRTAREQRAARPEPLPSTLESVERIEVMRTLLDAVQSLEEPYRSTIVMRFFDDLPPRAIARRQGVPVETVRTRVRRGLARLRERLDGDHGGRRQAFLGALLPIAGPLPLPLGLGLPVSADMILKWSGTVTMSSKLPLAAAAAVLIGLSVWTWRATQGGEANPVAPVPVSTMVSAPIEPETEEASPARRPDARLADASNEDQRREAAPADSGDWIVRGTVFQPREPRAGATVIVQLYEGYEAVGEPVRTARLTSDAQGRFAWELPAPDATVTLRARPELEGELYFGDDPVFVIRGDPPPQDLELRVYPLDSTVSGHVRDRAELPLAGASVRAFGSEVRTDAEGYYRLNATSHFDRIRVHAWAQGFAQSMKVAQSVGPGGAAELDFVLDGGCVVAGRVFDEDGAPVEDAQVTPFGAESVGRRTDADGRFEVAHLAREEETHRLWVTKPGYVMTRAEVAGEGRERAQVEIVLERGVRIEGRVVAGDSGAPVAGARLTAGFSIHDFEGVHAISGDEGGFTLRTVGRDVRTLWTRRAGFALARIDLDLASTGSVLTGVEVAMGRGHFVGGRVVDPAGRPRAGVSISARLDDEYLEGSTRSGEDGRFMLSDLPDGEIELEVYGQGIVRLNQRLDRTDRDDVELVVESAGRLAGRVVDGVTGEPLGAFTIRFVAPVLEEGEQRLPSYTADWGEGRSFTRADGTWDSGDENLKPDTVVGIQASSPGYAAAVSEHVVIATDPEPDELVLRLYPGVRVTGGVVAIDTGAPIADALVRRYTDLNPLKPFDDTDTRGRMWTRTDAAGRFELNEVPAGPMSLVIDHPSWKTSYHGPFSVPTAGTVAPRWVEMRHGGRITGVLRSPLGAALPGETITISGMEVVEGPQHKSMETETDAQGRFEFARLCDGLYQLSHHVRRGNHGIYATSRGVRIEDEGTVEADLQPPGTGSISGRLEYAGDLPEFVVLHAGRPTGFAVPAEPGQLDRFAAYRSGFAEKGRFTLEGLEPGPWVVTVSHSSYQNGWILSGEATAEITDGGSAEVWIEVTRNEL